MSELTHGSVEQLLEVLGHVRANHRRGVRMPTAYHDAVRDVANRHRVTYQTIGDFRRRLGLADVSVYSALIDRWLRGDASGLRDVIKRHSTPSVRTLIDGFFSAETGSSGASMSSSAPGPRTQTAKSIEPARLEEIRIRVPQELAQRLNLAHMAGMGPTLEGAAIALLEAGFEASKPRIRRYLDATVGAT